ncbi:MAG TPA: UDP-N-acetylmuramoyl-L-alanyl-D-glutamate--2,6-diaminopimelate ligase [Methylibium sp.]|uniref:Mur ligase family protein n=1 Tax=Methylibium sp. TaxID=2067992 RepID=UPI002DC05F45|nr:UDP-N-acetylmuramoyl-L-alanyl-D-glutamate--2,6-diaminopimelate ligase [Methylibium sp.]HEU4460587.1 UDP-N-acetylmuramoyl-L-alanyl-D-glutamate--2,6-diaminopimelate ligase [Methylibium sp.]
MLTRLRSPDAAARWLREWTRGALVTDSRRVRAGDAFIAWPGYTADGRRFVEGALRSGAATCLVEAEGVEAFGFDDARIGALPGLKAATGSIADAFFGRPSQTLRVAAVTGTNGKTSSAWWIAQALSLCGRRCGVVGTLGIGEPPLAAAQGEPHGTQRPGSIESTGLTTPDPVVLQQGFARMRDAGLAACAIEASSIGLVEHRLAGTRIEVAVFTNFTRDHLDHHGTMAAYWQAKRTLFGWPGLRAAVINLDDVQGAALAEELQAAPLDRWTTSLQRRDARLHASALGYRDGGLAFTVHEGEHAAPVRTALIGDYNAANLLGVIGALRAMGVPLAEACAVLPRLTPVPGRMQRVEITTSRSPDAATAAPGRGEPGSGRPAARVRDGIGLPEVVVDYAHTPDALEKALGALRPLAAARGGRLVCVFGCGGDRDASKRPLMGAAAERLADAVVLTSDNPRREKPRAILDQIVAGLAEPARAQVIEDRRAAIAAALREAGAGDVVLIAGKGHEDYQELDGVRHPFDDVAEARTALEAHA